MNKSIKNSISVVEKQTVGFASYYSEEERKQVGDYRPQGHLPEGVEKDLEGLLKLAKVIIGASHISEAFLLLPSACIGVSEVREVHLFLADLIQVDKTVGKLLMVDIGSALEKRGIQPDELLIEAFGRAYVNWKHRDLMQQSRQELQWWKDWNWLSLYEAEALSREDYEEYVVHYQPGKNPEPQPSVRPADNDDADDDDYDLMRYLEIISKQTD